MASGDMLRLRYGFDRSGVVTETSRSNTLEILTLGVFGAGEWEPEDLKEDNGGRDGGERVD